MRAEIKEYLKTVLDRIQNYQNNASGVQHNQHIIDLPYLNEFIKIHINNSFRLLNSAYCKMYNILIFLSL